MDRARLPQCSEKGDFGLTLLGKAWWRICSGLKGDPGNSQVGLGKARHQSAGSRGVACVGSTD